MKHTHILELSIFFLSLTVTSCTKTQETVQPPSQDSAASLKFTDAPSAERGLAEPSQSEEPAAPIKPKVVDFTNRKPFKFTITADIEAKDLVLAAYVDEDGTQIYDSQEQEDPEEIKVLVAINDVDGKYPILYDLDCESDGTYEFTGLTTTHAYCTYKNHSGKHQISVRGDIPGIILCARKGDIHELGDIGIENDDYIRIMPQRADIPSYVNHIDRGVIIEVLSDYFYSEPVHSIDDWGDIAWKSMAAFASGCEILQSIPENPPNLKDVTDMRHMFRDAKVFNQPLDKWDVSNVTNMNSMFDGAKAFNQPLDKWDVSNVTNMQKMFAHAESFNQPLNQWNVARVTDMLGMFWKAKAFNQPLDKWDVSNVTDMSGMFVLAKSFKKSLKSWGIPNPTDFSNRKPFKFTISTNIEPKADVFEYEDKPKKKLSNKVEVLVAVNDVDGKYPFQYDLDCDSDGKYEFSGLTTSQYCTYKRNTGNHQISVRGDIPAMILCARESPECDYCDDDTDDYRRIVPVRFDVKREFPSGIFYEEGEPVITIDDWGDIQWRSMYAFASNCRNLQTLPESAPNLKKVTDMRYMFHSTDVFNQPLNHWDVSNVIDMSHMFAVTTSFNHPLEKWDVSNVTNMAWMFFYAQAFNQPLEKWDVSNVTNMSRMFSMAEAFNQPLDKWNVSNVKDMQGMFSPSYSQNWVMPKAK